MDFTHKLLAGLIAIMVSISVMLLNKIDSVHSQVNSIHGRAIMLAGKVAVVDNKTVYIQKEVSAISKDLKQHTSQAATLVAEFRNNYRELKDDN